MGRLWIGIGLMVVLLAMGIGMLIGGGIFFRQLSEDLMQAGELALTENWQAAGEKAVQCRETWDTYRRFWSAFTDHAPVEEMETLFAQLDIFRVRQMDVDFAAVCRALAHLAEAMEEAHGLYWWSLL